MALNILSSNRVETLQARLADELARQPLADPFAPEVIVVPTYAMARWLNLRFAQQQGIAANFRYPLAGEWIWQCAAAMTEGAPRHDPYSAQALTWPTFELLPELVERDAFPELQAYLEIDDSGVRRWQLAQRIAAVFERYQLYRPQWIRDWAAGEGRHWQAGLWRALLERIRLPHRAEVIARAIGRVARDDAPPDLSERTTLFALSSLAPVYVEFIHALASKTRLLMFQHSPTDQYWADLVSDRQQARRRLENPRQAQYLDSGNSLLSSWGRQGQAMQDLLLDFGEVTGVEIDANHPPGEDSLLRVLQKSLFELSAPGRGLVADDSLSVHVCHSPMRECQVLHDFLLRLLDRNPALRCEDILVMSPEIGRYAPFIEAAFQYDASGKRPTLPWNISDIGVSDNNPLAKIFLQLLRLPRSRFTRSEILAYLECPAIRARFAIDDSMLETVYKLIESARVHWGIDATQRGEIGLPQIHQNTWAQAWERIFAGYAMGEHDSWRGIAPLAEVDAASGLAIARLRHLFERLEYWRRALASETGADRWQRRLNRLLEEFLVSPAAPDDELQPLRDAINELGDSREVRLDPSLVAYWMERQLASTQLSGRLYSGGVTFCGMQPMRNIPFPVICVIGMHDQAFPRRQRNAEFDLMANEWRPGDPLAGDEDRYLMLETLLCARRNLYFSYCGRSLRDNSECQPSTLLRELLDYIDEHAGVEPPLSEAISWEHPMQPFSVRNYHHDAPGYDAYWFETAIDLQQRPICNGPSPWQIEILRRSPESTPTLELRSLLSFFSHPVRYFYRQRLGIRIPERRRSADEECFELDALQRWQLAQRIARGRIAGREPGFDAISSAGLLPHGEAASNEWQALHDEFRLLFECAGELQQRQASSRGLELPLGDGFVLVGEIEPVYDGLGLVHISASKKPRARALIELWICHLALCASAQLAPGEASRLAIAAQQGFRFDAIAENGAAALLREYVDIYRQGIECPLPIFPKSSYAFASCDDRADACAAALREWRTGSYPGAPAGEEEDEYTALALHAFRAEPVFDPLFEAYSRRVFGPLVEHGVSDD